MPDTFQVDGSLDEVSVKAAVFMAERFPFLPEILEIYPAIFFHVPKPEICPFTPSCFWPYGKASQCAGRTDGERIFERAGRFQGVYRANCCRASLQRIGYP